MFEAYSEGNLFSLLAFFLWVPIALWGAWRWRAPMAATLLMLLPVMFLPEGVYFDLPGVVPLTKGRIAVLALLAGALIFHRRQLKTRRVSKWFRVCVFVLLAGGVVTTLRNTQSLHYGSVYLLGHQPYDAVTIGLMGPTLDWILPFALGAAMVRSQRDLRTLFRLLVGATVFYGLFQLIEIRLSPQLNVWVYGYFQHSFEQTLRGGGYRPTVFMAHGLAVAMFTMVGLLAAATLYKTKQRIFGVGAGWAMTFLLVLAVLNKSAAALLYALVALSLVLWFRPKTQLRVAALLGIAVLVYPALRAADLIPVDQILEIVGRHVEEERMTSLKTRFDNEEVLLERAGERVFFGWGGLGRRDVYDAYMGTETSISDGDWIITLGGYGIIGFFAKYLLLVTPIFFAARNAPRLPRQSDRRFLSTLALMVAFSAFDLIPNGVFNYLPVFFSGALFGCTPRESRRPMSRRIQTSPPSAGPNARPGYASTGAGPS